ncbi:MAG: IS21 family transposase [Bryobacterales bacterium]|nr:IS21 family transposase [Bryobacterales bacterium]
MAHVLKMAIVDSIRQLRALHWSARRIARHLEIDRGTVRKYLQGTNSGPKPAISPAGSDGSKPATHPPAPGGSAVDDGGADSAALLPDSKPAIPPAGSAGQNAELIPTPRPEDSGGAESLPANPAKLGRPSECQPYQPIILAKLEQGLSAQRIYQDLASEHGFSGSYDSVKRFVRRLGRSRALPMRRMECAAGEEAQVDFGTGAPVVGADGKRRKTHVFRVVLSHSRKAYSEATFRQTTEDFIGCLENAFWHFGGRPRILVIDNLRAAVKHPDWFDPELVPKLRSFCQHYGIVILPTKPYMPRHKGKVESGVKYVQSNALKARQFSSLQAENEYLARWEATVADTRIHGTTRQHVGRVFREIERAALQPLPRERFPSFQEAPRKVSRDGHVEVAKAYYSVPPEYLGHTVWARWDGRLVRIFNQRFEPIALHVRHEKGRFSTHAQHLAREKINGLERGVNYLLSKVSGIGPETRQWAEAMLTARGIEGTRVLQGVLSLTRRHPSEALEKACEIALSHGAFQLRTLRQLIGRQAEQQIPLPFLEEHPIIRPLDDYAAVVAAALTRKADAEARFSRHGWTKASPAVAQQNGPEGVIPQGPADMLPPRSDYPLPGCSPAEPDSVSPDTSTLVNPSVSHHLEKENECHE